MKLRLQVLISTYDQGINGITGAGHPVMEGVEYLISWQRPDLKQRLGERILSLNELPDIDIPVDLRREDIKIYVSSFSGLSRNRNVTLKKASAPLCLISDDDMNYRPEHLRQIISTFESNPDTEIAAFQYEGDDKEYPAEEFDLNHPRKGWYVSSVELAFRLRPVRSAGIIFDPELGLGSELYGCGEEDLWLHMGLTAGLSGRYFPFVVGRHQGLSTGVKRAADKSILRAQGYVHGRKRTSLAPLRLAVKAVRVSRRSGSSIIRNLWWLWRGWLEGYRRK